MTELEATEAIYQQFVDGWTEAGRNTPGSPDYVPIAFRNETFSLEQLGELGAWARASIIWTVAEQTTQGSAPWRKWSRSGYVFVQLFAPAGTGVALLARLATDVRSALEGRRIGDVNTQEGASGNVASANTPGDHDDPVWTMQVVTVRFSFEETR